MSRIPKLFQRSTKIDTPRLRQSGSKVKVFETRVRQAALLRFASYGRLMLGIVVLGVLSVLGTGFAAAQSGSMQGVVVDAQGASIPNATIRVTDVDKGIMVREIKSSASGEFQLQPLNAGRYSLEVTAPGMTTLKRENVVLGLSQDMNLGNVALAVGSENTTVTVDAQPDLIGDNNVRAFRRHHIERSDGNSAERA